MILMMKMLKGRNEWMDVHKEDQPCLGLFFLGEAGGVVAVCLNFELQICRCKFKACHCCVVCLDKKLCSTMSILTQVYIV